MNPTEKAEHSPASCQKPSGDGSGRLYVFCALLFLVVPSLVVATLGLWKLNQDARYLWLIEGAGTGVSPSEAESNALRSALSTALRFVHREGAEAGSIEEPLDQVVSRSQSFVVRLENPQQDKDFEGRFRLQARVAIRRQTFLETLKELHIATVAIPEFPYFHCRDGTIKEVADGTADAFLDQMEQFFRRYVGLKPLILDLIPRDIRWFDEDWPESRLVLLLAMEIGNLMFLVSLFIMLGSYASRKARFPLPRWAAIIFAGLPIPGICAQIALSNMPSPGLLVTAGLLLAVWWRMSRICPRCRSWLTIFGVTTTDAVYQVEKGKGSAICEECGYSRSWTFERRRK